MSDTEFVCPVCPPGTHTRYGSPQRPFDVVTIGQGGWGGHHSCSSGHTSHYGHTFMDRVGPDTLIIDKTTCEWAHLVHGATAGPMLDATLPEGTVSEIGAPLRQVAADYYGSPGAFDRVATDVYALFWLELGASVSSAETFTCDRSDGSTCRDCQAVTVPA